MSARRSLLGAPIRSSSPGIHDSAYTSWYPYPVPIGSIGSTERKLKISEQITLRSTGRITWRVTLNIATKSSEHQIGLPSTLSSILPFLRMGAESSQQHMLGQKAIARDAKSISRPRLTNSADDRSLVTVFGRGERRGLKKRYLNKFKKSVDGFYRKTVLAGEYSLRLLVLIRSVSSVIGIASSFFLSMTTFRGTTTWVRERSGSLPFRGKYRVRFSKVWRHDTFCCLASRSPADFKRSPSLSF